MKNIKYQIILGLILLALISSLILSLKPVSEICDINSECEIVYYSQYNSLFGFQNSYFGVVIFTFLIALILSYFINPTNNKKTIINLIIFVGSLLALYFLYIQNFILQAYCKYCLIVDLSMVISLILILPELKKGLFNFKNDENITTGS